MGLAATDRSAYFEYAVREARKCSRTYAETMFKDESGDGLRLAAIHESIHTFVEENQFGIIEVPREHGKTTTMLELITHEIGQDPELRHKIVGNAEGEALKRSKASKEIVETPLYQSIFPHITRGREWTDSKFTVKREGITPESTVESYGVLSKATGGRCDRLWLDDVDDEEVIVSEAKRKRIQDRVINVWINLLPPQGKAFLLHTPWHEADTGGKLKELGWPVLRFPGVKELLARKKTIGSLAFARGYELIPLSSEAAPIDGAWFGYWYEDQLPEMTGVGIAVDPTVSMEPDADWTR
jgi:hypothetical protein